MTIITEKNILDVQNELSNYGADAVEKLMADFSAEQSYVMGYTFVITENRPENLRQFGMFINTLIWKAFASQVADCPVITEEDLLETAKACEEEAKELHEQRKGKTDEEISEHAVKLMESRRQRSLYDFIYGFINSEVPADDYEGMGTLSSMGQIVIEAFDRKINTNI